MFLRVISNEGAYLFSLLIILFYISSPKRFPIFSIILSSDFSSNVFKFPWFLSAPVHSLFAVMLGCVCFKKTNNFAFKTTTSFSY